MEMLNPLEKLTLLEEKILALVEALRSEKSINAKLLEEKKELVMKIENIEKSLLKGTKNIEDLNQERLLTKMVVDELISSIDKIIEVE